MAGEWQEWLRLTPTVGRREGMKPWTQCPAREAALIPNPISQSPFNPNSDIGDNETVEMIESGRMRGQFRPPSLVRSQDSPRSSSFDLFGVFVVPTSLSGINFPVP
jgi:hypothetical protein